MIFMGVDVHGCRNPEARRVRARAGGGSGGGGGEGGERKEEKEIDGARWGFVAKKKHT